jgi:NAD(P)-dependent dehydrogenase (short-subunit alcohol dehydrogenase family)
MNLSVRRQPNPRAEGLSKVRGPLSGRTAIITGAGRGIGAVVSCALSRAGASVVLAARDDQALEALAADISSAGGHAVAVPTDITNPASVRRLVEQTLGAFGRLDAAFNNATTDAQPPTPLAELSTDGFDTDVCVNLRGVFLAMKYEIPSMLRGGGGCIVNMASSAGVEAVAGAGGNVASNFGVIGLTRAAALDYADSGLRVNALAAGLFGSHEEVADVIVWLCSDAASFITGETLRLDRGLLTGMPFDRAAGNGRR